MEKKPRYLTTTLPYVNADPHIGFGLEIVQADALARYWRLIGHKVFFNTGTDEHGQKVFGKAKEEGKEIQAYVDHYAGEFQKLQEALNLSYDAFIRTTDEKHKKAAQGLWRRCNENGDIYKKKYKGLYCVGDEMFLRESDLVDGKCPNHPNMDPVMIEEENYFFALKKYEDTLLEYLENEQSIVPEWRRQEAIKFVKDGLEDFSISREKKRLSWGVPVPDDNEQVMYVWFDALTNYISTLDWPDGENFKKFWDEGETMQVAGKDQIRFQSIMWQAMLLSGGVKPTDQILYHGFITSGGHKMSKSFGNVISPYELVNRYGTDGARYILLRHVHPFDDSDLTWERMDEWYNANLANGLGNFVARVMKMSEQHLNPKTIEPGLGLGFALKNVQEQFKNRINTYRFNDAMDYVWGEIAFGDDLIQKNQPFKLIKAEPEKAVQDIANLVQRIWRISILLEPFMPDTAKKIQEAVKTNKKPDNLFVRLGD